MFRVRQGTPHNDSLPSSAVCSAPHTAPLERALIAERTKAGLRTRDPEAIRKVRNRRDAAHLDGILRQLDSWLPTVRRMRPDQPWGDVVRVLNRGLGHGDTVRWTVERLRRTVRRLVDEGIVEASLLGRAQPQLK